MTSKSRLTKRESLVIEANYGFEKCYNTLLFSLMKGCWMFRIERADKYEQTDWDYSIVLREKYSGANLPFEVTTYLEEKRSSTQMFCSRTTVSCEREILFKGKDETTYDRLPELKLYKQINIVCTFYPSNVLSVYNEKEGNLRRSLVWDFEKPTTYEVCESTTFGLLDSNWKFGMQSTDTSYWEIYLRNCSGLRSFEPFEIKAYIEDRRTDTSFLCSKLTVSSPHEVLYKFRFGSLYEKLPDAKRYDDIRFVCVLGTAVQSSLIIKDEGIDDGMKCSKKENGNSAQQDKTSLDSCCSSKLCEIEALTVDFSHLLDNNLFTDINLKSGEDVIIPAHKAILAGRSEVFTKMLQHEMTEIRSGIIEIKDIEPSILRLFVRYLYSGKLPDKLTEDMVCKLYSACGTYAVNTLRRVCSAYLIKSLNTDNYVKFLMLGDAHNDAEFTKAISDFVLERPALMRNEKWMIFSKKSPVIANEIYQKYMTKCML